MQPALNGHAALFQIIEFPEQCRQVHDDPVSDHAIHAGPQDAGRYEMEDRLFLTDDKRVTGVVPALETDHYLRPLGQKIDDLPLAFVTPLGTDDDYAPAHRSPVSREQRIEATAPWRCSPPRRCASANHPAGR